jgi:hypothetical protein
MPAGTGLATTGFLPLIDTHQLTLPAQHHQLLLVGIQVTFGMRLEHSP